jgi:hypothetical protein
VKDQVKTRKQGALKWGSERLSLEKTERGGRKTKGQVISVLRQATVGMRVQEELTERGRLIGQETVCG